MGNDAWKPDTTRLTSAEQIDAEWKRALVAKDSMDSATWREHATRLREAAAILRDTLVPVASMRERLSALVDEMSQYLPERRTARRE
jgi:hypothetical protein